MRAQTLRAWLVAAAAWAGCGGASWSVPLPALDRVPLSVQQPDGRNLLAVGGALGSGGDALFLRYDGTEWTRLTTGTSATLWWVHAFSADDAYAVGEQGTILHYAGGVLAV